MLVEEHALFEDGGRGDLVLAFAPDISPRMLVAFAPHVADAMRGHMRAADLTATRVAQSYLPATDHKRAAPAEKTSDEGLVEGGPAWQSFWFGGEGEGAPGAFDFEAALETFRTRVVRDSDTAEVLVRDHGVHWADLPRQHKDQMYIPGPAAGDPGVDVAALMLATRAEDWEWDGVYARVSPHRLTEDLTDLHPTDISALRRGLVGPAAFNSDRKLSARARASHGLAALTTTAAYLAVPHTHFIPADLSLDVATTAALGPKTLAAMRLPGPWIMVLHEPVPLAALHAGDQELETLIAESRVSGSDHAVLGGVLAACPDHTLDTTLGLVLVTSLHPNRGRQWYLQPAAFGTTHGAGRLLYAYAAQLAFGTWRQPPAPPVQERGKPGSAKALKRLAKHPDARAGALHRMNILDYQPPLAPPQPGRARPEDSSHQGRDYGTFRRAHWTENTRIGIRDETGNLVGPVYKEGAIEGVTFTREPVFILRSRVRPDLPLRPDTRNLYHLREQAQTPADHGSP
ncbi:hypothetical protein ACFVUW_11045 [Streptomyces xiamenensis]|uniref:hypothetical protein n=1 Tax=Streptomyces xiamenensis TaxID=408015 RepID=UPI0036EDFF10